MEEVLGQKTISPKYAAIPSKESLQGDPMVDGSCGAESAPCPSTGQPALTSRDFWQGIHLDPTVDQINRLRRRQKRPILRRLSSEALGQCIPLLRVFDGALEGLADVRRVFGKAGEVGEVGRFRGEGGSVWVCF
jgi:hypothetical protein